MLSLLMRVCAFLVVLALTAKALPSERYSRVCKPVPSAGLCRQIHGRLAFYNGTPSFRVWQIGTHHLFGIYSSAEGLRCDQSGACRDNESPQLPKGIPDSFFKDVPPRAAVFADFDICPLEPVAAGAMQAACLQKAKNARIQR